MLDSRFYEDWWQQTLALYIIPKWDRAPTLCLSQSDVLTSLHIHFVLLLPHVFVITSFCNSIQNSKSNLMLAFFKLSLTTLTRNIFLFQIHILKRQRMTIYLSTCMCKILIWGCFVEYLFEPCIKGIPNIKMWRMILESDNTVFLFNLSWPIY